ncbi:MAG: proteinral secretion pathway protein D [Planctomycetota bacterium]|nr:MAG: proteinral secretion pathway protein D [Planctomycetota bacterium]
MRSFTSLALFSALVSMTAMCLGEEPAPADATSPAQVSIEVRYLSIAPKLLDEIGLKPNLIVPASPAKPVTPVFAETAASDDGSPIQLISATTVVETRIPVAVRSLSDAQLKHLIETAQGDRRVSCLSAPKVTLFDGQVGEVRDASERPFVVDVDHNRHPVIHSISEGTQFAVRPRLKDQGIVLDLQFQFANVVDVHTTSKNNDQRIQVPTVKSTRIELSAMVGDGKSLVLWADPLPAEPATPAKKNLSGLLKKKATEAEVTTLVLLITA